MMGRGLETKDLADALGVTPQSVSHAFSGRRVDGFARVLDWCEALRVCPNELLGYETEPTPTVVPDLDPRKAALSFAAILRDMGYQKEVAMEIARLALRSAQEAPPAGIDPEAAIELKAVTRTRDVLDRE